MKKLLKPAFAIILCAALVAGIIALPELIARYNDTRMFSDELGYLCPITPRADCLSEEGMKYKTARALYIDHTYVAQYADGSSGSGGEDELAALKEAGIVPTECVLYDGYYSFRPNDCAINIEPVSGVVTYVSWSGDGIDADELFDRFISYLGLSDADDWMYVEYKGAYRPDMTLGRYSPELQLYISASADVDGMASNISVSSHTETEMKPLLALGS